MFFKAPQVIWHLVSPGGIICLGCCTSDSKPLPEDSESGLGKAPVCLASAPGILTMGFEKCVFYLAEFKTIVPSKATRDFLALF